MLEEGYGHSIGHSCVPGVPSGPFHRGPRGLRDGPRGPKIRSWSMSSELFKIAFATQIVMLACRPIAFQVLEALLDLFPNIQIFGPRGPSWSPRGPRWEGPGGTPGTQPGPMLWPYPPSSTSMGSQWAVLQHGLTKGVLTRDSSWCPHGTLHPRAIPETLPWSVKFGSAQITETFVLMVFKGLDVQISSWVQHTQRTASESS